MSFLSKPAEEYDLVKREILNPLIPTNLPNKPYLGTRESKQSEIDEPGNNDGALCTDF